MDNYTAGLRSHDVNLGLRNVESSSGLLAKYFTNTRAVGMAASVAVHIRGHDVVNDVEALKVVAADQLDVEPFAFDEVLRILQEADLVTVSGKGPNKKLFERIPLHRDLYEVLGEVWSEQHPTEIEEASLGVVETLATAPRPSESLKADLGLEDAEFGTIRTVGQASEIIKIVDVGDGEEILYSPFFSFENPEAIANLFERHAADEVQEAFAQVKAYQGFPLAGGNDVLSEAVGRGLLPAPSVAGVKGEQAFAFSPYAVDRDLLTARKAVLDKAFAVLACVRYGQNFGSVSPINNPAAILEKLLDASSDHRLRPHSEHRSQYRLLHKLGIVQFIPSGNWVSVQLIDTEDNVAAVSLAQDLLRHGEPMTNRGIDAQARELLYTEGQYLHPVLTIKKKKKSVRLPDEMWEPLVDAVRGGARL